MADEMFGGEITSAAIIDAYEVVAASLWKWQDAAVEKNDGNLRFVQGFDDRLVCSALCGTYFQRRKEDARHAALDELLA